MKTMLLFPFRLIGWLLRAVFYPWYLALLLRLPWWMLGGLAVMAANVAAKDFQTVTNGRATLQTALISSVPNVVPIIQFDPARDVSEIGELHVSGFYRPVRALTELDTSGPNEAYVPLMVDRTNRVGAVLMVLHLNSKGLRDWLDAQGQGALVPVQINGAIQASNHQAKIVRQLQIAGYDVAPDVTIIRPFYRGRAAGLATALGTSYVVVIGLSVIAVVLGILAVIRFRRWRQRRGAANRGPQWGKHPVARATSVQPAAPPPVMPPPLPKMTRPPAPILRDLPATSKDATPVIATKTKPPKPAALRTPFKPRTAKQIVDEIFGPNYGRTPPGS